MKTAIQDDECDVMGKHIAIQLRELPSYDRVLANFDLQKVLMNYRLKNMRGVLSSTSYSRPSSVTTTDIIHAALVNSDINSDFLGSDVQYLN